MRVDAHAQAKLPFPDPTRRPASPVVWGGRREAETSDGVLAASAPPTFSPMESRAAARAAAKAAIYRVLAKLPPEDRLVVLEDTLFELRGGAPSVLGALAAMEESALTPAAEAPSSSTAPASSRALALAPDAGIEADERRLWGRILTWCREHPHPSGYHEVRAVAVALLPELAPAQAWQRVYVEVKRKSKQGRGRLPLFDFQPGSKQRFRLVEAGEAHSKGVAARRS